MGAMQSLVSSEGAAAAAGTLVFAGALGYSVTKLAKQEEPEEVEKRRTNGGECVTEEDEARERAKKKKRSKKRGAGADGAAEVKATPTSTSAAAQVIPGSFDVPVATSGATTEDAKSKTKKGKARQVSSISAGIAASPNVAQLQASVDGGGGGGGGGDDRTPSTLPSEGHPTPTASTSGSKSKKSKKKKKSASGVGGAGASASSLALPSINSNANATESSSSKVLMTGEASAAPTDVTAPPTMGAGSGDEGAKTARRGSKSRDTLIPGDVSSAGDDDDDDDDDDRDDGDEKPFLASLSLSSSKQQQLQLQHSTRPPKSGLGSKFLSEQQQQQRQQQQQSSQYAQAYPDTDNSWTHVRRGGRHNHPNRNASSPTHISTSAAELTTSDAGVVSSMTDDGYPSSSPVVERAEDEDGEAPALHLGSGSAYVRASRGSSSNDGSGINLNADASTNTVMHRKTLAERILPKPRRTGVEDMLETPDFPPLARVVHVRPLPGEKPATGFTWADYEDVHVDEGAGHDADGEDDGWGVVRHRRSRTDQVSSLATTVAGMGGVGGGGSTSQTEKPPGAMTKKQRQHAKKRDAAKNAKADAEDQRLAALAKHKQQLESMRIMEQISKTVRKAPSGGMTASVNDNGKLVWE